MKNLPAYQRSATAALLSALALSACVVAPPQPRPVVYNTYPVYAQPAPPPATVIVDVPPPPAQVEVVPGAPFIGAVWVGGYWGWNGGRHLWTPGHYVRPVAGYRFVPHRWENGGGRWALRGGFWVR
jgi:WXXGXW repeat (2 copies)